MAPSIASTYPVAALMEQAQALEAAITVCLADPSPKPVHRIRTATRRIEAQLLLLALLPELPRHGKQARKLLRILSKLRRAAGKVRDLDVLRDMLADRDQEPGLWTIEKSSDDKPGKKIERERKTLDAQLKKKREAQARSLLKMLKHHQGDVTRALEKLLEALRSAKELALPVSSLMDLSVEWFQAHAALPAAGADDEQMHAVRKAAKLTRYLLESSPEEARKARRLAESFEDLQQVGGHWHDLLTLQERSRKKLGKRAVLTRLAGGLRQDLLQEFRRRLDGSGFELPPKRPAQVT